MAVARGGTRLRGSASDEARGGVVGDIAQELASGTQVGDYCITGVLGSGGMGTVYAARHPVIGKEVAIKVVNAHLSAEAEVKRRFLTEARALTQIEHRNVVDVYSFGTLDDGRSYLVMELIRGRSLADLIDADALDLYEIVAILGQVACALAACHAEQVIHRDLKPENVFVFGRGRNVEVKLIDFGIARVEGLGMCQRLTGEGRVLGTPAYMAPEQARGVDIDARCDLYALGVLGYEMLTGALPFDRSTVVDTLLSVLTTVATPPSQRGCTCPSDLELLISELMAKQRDERPSTSEVRVRLASICEAMIAAQVPRYVSPRSCTTAPVAQSIGRDDTPLCALRATRPNRVWRVALVSLVVFGLALAWVSLRAPAAAPLPRAEAAPDPAAAAATALGMEREQLLPGDSSGETAGDSSERARAGAAARPTGEFVSVAPGRESTREPSAAKRRRGNDTRRSRSRRAGKSVRVHHPDALMDPFRGGRR